MIKTGISATASVAPGERSEVAEGVGVEAAACELCGVEGWGGVETEGSSDARRGGCGV